MKKLAATMILTFCFGGQVLAQRSVDEKAAVDVANKMFAEMANHDPAAIAALYLPGSQLAAVIKNKEGKSVTKFFTGEAFSKNFAEKKSEIKEDMYEVEAKIYGDLALVFGRYVFFVDNKISHCGVNAFHMVRTDSGWKIANAASTIEPQGCTDKEKAMRYGPPK